MDDLHLTRKPCYWIITFVLGITLTGCVSVFKPDPQKQGALRSVPERPKIGEARKLLRSLPSPAGQVSAAVYGFGDLTGQNKPSPSSGLSTAVTQGAASSFVGLMLESGWFRPMERVGLQSILSERNLWDQRLRAQQRDALAPMPPASIIFEGGIVAYETNTRSGGYGAQILGIGGSKEYREDVLTVSLRAVNAQSGVVLNSTTSTKRIFSQTVNTGIFGFVDNDIILETEVGFAANESVQLGLEEAIAFALIDLIAGGLKLGTWQLENPQEIKSDVFTSFLSSEDMEQYLASSNVENDKPDAIQRESKNLESDTDVGLGIPGAENTEQTSKIRGRSADESQLGVNTGRASMPGPVVTSNVAGNSDQDSSEVKRANGEPETASRTASRKTTTNQITKKETVTGNSGSSESAVSKQTDKAESVASAEPKSVKEPSSRTDSQGNKGPAAQVIRYLVVGYTTESSQIDEFRRWLDIRYAGVEATVIRSADQNALQVAIGPFEDTTDVQLVATDLQGQGIPVTEAPENLDKSRLLKKFEAE